MRGIVHLFDRIHCDKQILEIFQVVGAIEPEFHFDIHVVEPRTAGVA